MRRRFRDLLVPNRREGGMKDLYGESYFRRAGGKAGSSGYGTYERATSNADVAAYLLWRFLPFETSLDVGAASGFLVEALLELGYDARGCDISPFAVEHAAPHVRPRLSVVDLGSDADRRELATQRFSLVTALEVLEHIEPSLVPGVLGFLRSISDGYLVATIPSIGRNVAGPDGFPDGKVRTEVLDHYRAVNASFDGPIPGDDLMLDAEGNPVEGHICVASFDWWTSRFEAAGFRRRTDIEALMHPVLGRHELSVAWNLYVFQVADQPELAVLERSDDELAGIEVGWKLDERPIGVHAQNITRDTVGEDAVAAIVAEYDASQRRAEQHGT